MLSVGKQIERGVVYHQAETRGPGVAQKWSVYGDGPGWGILRGE